MTCGCQNKEVPTKNNKPQEGKCCCDPKTVCQEVCQRSFDGWVNAAKIKLVKCGKYVKLIFTDVRSFTLYQVYNKYNKKLNCDRRIIKTSKDNYNQQLDNFKNRTSYLEFQSCHDKHIQFSFYLKEGKYDEEKNIWTWTVKPDKLFVDDVLVKEYQKYYGTNVQCSLDATTRPKGLYYIRPKALYYIIK